MRRQPPLCRRFSNKTTENGATEAEAMAAAEKARELMDRYQIEAGSAGLAKGRRAQGHRQARPLQDAGRQGPHRLRRRAVLRQQGLADQEQ